MTSLSLREAAEQAGTSKSTIWRAVKSGRLSATRTDDSAFAIDPSESLSRVSAGTGRATSRGTGRNGGDAGGGTARNR